ncbi:hypothetical protein NG821_07225 [Prevotella cerevisiae]|uniref:Uncharacterized protein n=1 Tax=Segatella cerevisiae TaxID=2053716 RepID=A0ABT1BXS2_9BACT|nr:hypothetical protein [Segatella cerevisiae]
MDAKLQMLRRAPIEAKKIKLCQTKIIFNINDRTDQVFHNAMNVEQKFYSDRPYG